MSDVSKAPWYQYAENIKSVVIESGITTLGYGMIGDCPNLETVEFSDTVKNTGRGSFNNCPSLKSVVFPKNIESIDRESFGSCDNLTSITIMNNKVHIGNWCFGSDSRENLDVYFNGTEEEWKSTFQAMANSTLASANFHSISSEELSESELKAKVEKYGTVSAWEYRDYNNDGKSEAFAFVTTLSGTQCVYFISSNGNIKLMPTEFAAGYVYEGTARYIELNEHGFFLFDYGAGGSGFRTYLYSVKDGESYELDASGNIQGFYQNENTGKFFTTINDFSNGIHEYIDYDLIYDEYSYQFSIGERSKNEQIYGNYVYYINENQEVVITRYNGTNEIVIIPSEIEGKAVTTISGIEGPADLEYQRIGAFQNNENIKSVVIPDTVTTIEMHSFSSCYNLEQITMSENIKTIEQYAFDECKFSYIYLPKSIENIGEQAIGYSNGNVINDFVIYGFKGTIAETYANENDILFKARNNDDTIIQPLELSLDYKKISDYSTLPNDDTVHLIGYPVYEITAELKNVDIKLGNNISVQLNPSNEMTLINCSEIQTINILDSNETVTLKWTVRIDATKAYSTKCSVTAKADNSVESKAYLTLSFDNTIIGKDNRFDFTKDTWKFTNSKDYFDKGHFIRDKYFNSFFYDAPNITAQEIRNAHFSASKEDWGGSCYGMSVTAILGKLNVLDVTDYDFDATCVHDADSPKENDDIYSLIEAYHFSQKFPSVKNVWSEFYNLSINEQLNNLVESVENVKNGGVPVALGINWYDKNISRYDEDYETSGHEMVAYDIEHLGKSVKIKNLVSGQEEDYSIKISIYDCATSSTEPIYMYVDSDYSRWIIPKYCQNERLTDKSFWGDRDYLSLINFKGEGYFDIITDTSVLNWLDLKDYTSNYNAILSANNKTNLLIKWNNTKNSYRFTVNKLVDGVYNAGEEITTFFSNAAAEDSDGIAEANINYVLPSLTGEYAVSVPDGKATDIIH